jgi:beta-galactosidase
VSLATAGALLPPKLRAAALAPGTTGNGDATPTVVRLDAGWEFRKGAVDGIWGAWRAEDASLWEVASLPHCFNALDACDPDQPYFRGEGWYRTQIAVKNPFPEGRTVLHFRGAGQTTSVWVGSTLVGTHKGGYDEFVFDITDAVARLSAPETKDGVKVAVMCDNGPDLDRVPSDLGDFCLYGGLYRHVSLMYLPAVALDAVHVLPTVAADGSAEVRVNARLYNPSGVAGRCMVAIEISDAAGKQVYKGSKTLDAWTGFADIAQAKVSAPQLWSPETPAIYTCRATLTTAEGEMVTEERFGIRQIEFVENGPFRLNGKRVLLKGTHRHSDGVGAAAAMSDEHVREEMRLIREMGANFIRLGHYQQDRLVLEMCDELGLMVWEEAPWCRAGVGSEAWQQHAKAMLTSMIEQHYNHPSVILWGLGNEDDWPDEYPSVDQKAIRGFMTEMRDLAHSLDGSRMTSIRRCDFARDIPDVYSPSIWAGWYSGNFHEYEQSVTAWRGKVKRLIHVEWGADSHAGRHAEEMDPALRQVATGKGTDERGLAYLQTGGDVRMSRDGEWSETYACDLFDWHLKTLEKLDWLTGAAQWAFKDFASPLRGDNAIPRVNQKGVVERDLTKKESYYVFQSYWTKKPMAHIYGHSWPVRWGKAGEKRTVKVYSNCEKAELFLNGKSQGVKVRDSQNFPAAGLHWDVEFAGGKNELRVVATKGQAQVSDEVALTYQTEPWGKPAELRLAVKERKGDVVTVAAHLHDGKGVLCLDSRKLVRFSVAGAGKLLDNMGTARGSREVQLANGRAEISIAMKGGCALGVTSEGLQAALINI